MSINIKISKKLKFSIKEDKMQHIGNVTKALEDLKKNKNLYFLIKNTNQFYLDFFLIIQLLLFVLNLHDLSYN